MMTRRINQVSKRTLQNEGYLGMICNRESATLPSHFDYIESDGSIAAKFINKIFRTNQSYTKNLVRDNKLYSYQYYAYGHYNIYEIDLSTLKEVRIDSRHKLQLVDNKGECVELETVEPSEVVCSHISKFIKSPKVSSATMS